LTSAGHGADCKNFSGSAAACALAQVCPSTVAACNSTTGNGNKNRLHKKMPNGLETVVEYAICRSTNGRWAIAGRRRKKESTMEMSSMHFHRILRPALYCIYVHSVPTEGTT